MQNIKKINERPSFPENSGISYGATKFYEELTKEEQEYVDSQDSCTLSIQQPAKWYAKDMRIMGYVKRAKIAEKIVKEREK